MKCALSVYEVHVYELKCVLNRQTTQGKFLNEMLEFHNPVNTTSSQRFTNSFMDKTKEQPNTSFKKSLTFQQPASAFFANRTLVCLENGSIVSRKMNPNSGKFFWAPKILNKEDMNSRTSQR